MNIQPQHWYQSWRFPLVPRISHRKRDSQNSRYFDFRWLMFRFYLLSGPHLILGAAVNSDGIGIYANLLYLGIQITLLPFPRIVSDWIWKYLTFKGTGQDE